MCVVLTKHSCSLLLCSTGARQECPIKISPEKMVIEFQSKVQNVTCEPTTSGSRNIVKKVSWQLQPGNNTDSAILSVDPCKDWDLQPVCMATFTGIGKCHKALQFTLYSTSFLLSLFVSLSLAMCFSSQLH